MLLPDSGLDNNLTCCCTWLAAEAVVSNLFKDRVAVVVAPLIEYPAGVVQYCVVLPLSTRVDWNDAYAAEKFTNYIIGRLWQDKLASIPTEIN